MNDICKRCGAKKTRIVPPNLKVCVSCMKKEAEKRRTDFERMCRGVENYVKLWEKSKHEEDELIKRWKEYIEEDLSIR